jgi:hypothetical protein
MPRDERPSAHPGTIPRTGIDRTQDPVDDRPSPALGGAVLALSGAGFPLTQLAIRALGRRGATLVGAVTAGLLVRDVYLVATGTPGRLQPGPARLLWAETAVAALATGAGLVLLRDPDVASARQPGWRVPRGELVRRLAVGTLFGLHTMRYRIYLGPGSGRRTADS